MIVSVVDAAGVDTIRELFQEYRDSFGFTPCFQGFDYEVAALPGDYAPPSVDEHRCEAKRLYVYVPAHEGFCHELCIAKQRRRREHPIWSPGRSGQFDDRVQLSWRLHQPEYDCVDPDRHHSSEQ